MTVERTSVDAQVDVPVNEADLEEQLTPVLGEPPDEETMVGVVPSPRRDEVDEADYLEQLDPVGDGEDGYEGYERYLYGDLAEDDRA